MHTHMYTTYMQICANIYISNECTHKRASVNVHTFLKICTAHICAHEPTAGPVTAKLEAAEHMSSRLF